MFWRLFLPFTLLLGAISQEEDFGYAVHQVTEPVDHGEGPTWDPRTGLLYFVDIFAGRAHSYNPKTGETYGVELGGTVTPIVQVKGGKGGRFVVGVNRSVVLIEWDGKKGVRGEPRVLTTVAEEFPESRINDGKADSRGRLWFGTLGPENATAVAPDQGALYLIDRSNLRNPTKKVSPVSVSNGLAWNRANDKLYYIDTATYEVAEYDYEEKTGGISNRRTVVNFRKAIGPSALPDGMTIDVEDNLWVALYGGGSVVKVEASTGKILERIPVPAKYVTSVMWGGEDLDVLFVTTSRFRLDELQRQEEPGAGSVFAVTKLGTKGLPVFEADDFE